MENYDDWGLVDLDDETGCAEARPALLAWLAFVRAWLAGFYNVRVEVSGAVSSAERVGILRHWLMHNCSRAPYSCALSDMAALDTTANRFERRLARHELGPGRDYAVYEALLPKDLSSSQFHEGVCRISGLGRMYIYRMRFWGSARQRRASLTCYDHGWWRIPNACYYQGMNSQNLRPP